MYRAGEVSVRRAWCERATQPYSLGGGGTIYPGSRPAAVTTRNPRMITECLLTRSMLIKMYYHFMVCAYYVHCIYSLSISCRCSLSLFSLSNCIDVLFDTTILSESMNISLSLQQLSSLASPFSPSCSPLAC